MEDASLISNLETYCFYSIICDVDIKTLRLFDINILSLCSLHSLIRSLLLFCLCKMDQ